MINTANENLLVVLGNGFDIHCDLPSRYKDFFSQDFDALKLDNDQLRSNLINWLLRYFDIAKKSSSETLKKYILTRLGSLNDFLNKGQKVSSQGFNEWDVLFLYAYFLTRKDDWSFVESIIQMAVETMSHPPKLDLNKYRDLFENDSDMYLMIIVIKLLFDKDDEKLSGMCNQLHEFEKKFSNYINDKVKESNAKPYNNSLTYKDKAIDMLQRIIESNGHDFQNISVISFNYSLDVRFTKDFKDQTHMPINSWNNIHGVAVASDSNQWNEFKQVFKNRNRDVDFENVPPKIIFGINSAGIGVTDKRYKFTKECRKQTPDKEEVNTVNNLVDGHFPLAINKVIFYGHSLSEADHYELRKLLKKCVNANTEFVVYIHDRNSQTDKEYKNNLRDILQDTQVKNLKHLSLRDC